MGKGFVYVLAMLLTCVPVYGQGNSERDGGIKEPSVEAKAAILIDFETGRVLWGKNEDDPMAMASTTKIMTALLALEKGDMSDVVTVSRRASNAPKVKMYLTQGEKIPLKTLLYALMLQSSNDAAVAIAEHIGGTVEEFCSMMTERARELGATDTLFLTPNGLDEGDHHSTAADMAHIARYAMGNPEFVKIINTQTYVGQSDLRTYEISNKNRMLTEYDGANGIKTGYTGKAGYCFVGSANRGGMGLISVVLASGWGSGGREQKWTDTKRILNYGFDNYSVETILTGGGQAGAVPLTRSRQPEVVAVYTDTVRAPLNAAEKEGVEIITRLPESIKAPVAAGDRIGTCDVYINGEKYKEIALYAASSAERHDLKTSMEKVLSYLFGIVTTGDVKVTLPEF